MAAALTLGRRGHRVVVLEATPKVCDVPRQSNIEGIRLHLLKIAEVGAGIQVSPNMLRLFDR